MFRFQITLHVRPASATAGEVVERDGRRFPTLAAAPQERFAPFPVSFEEASEALMRLPRMFIEPDGSLVWVSSDAARPWQVDGMLYDRAGRLAYVELKGECPAEAFDALLACFGWPQAPLAMQLQREGWLLDEATFRVWASD